MKKILLIIALLPIITSCGKDEPLFLGRWAGALGDCSDPVVITAKTVSFDEGKTIPLVLDEGGSIVLGGGRYLSVSKDGKQLTYSNPEGSGDYFDLMRCK